MSELKSTLTVFNEADLNAQLVSYSGGAIKDLVGNDERPSERIFVRLVSFKPGSHAPLHWHPIEGLYYVISGRAVLTDIEDKTYNIGPGSVIYYPPGIAGSHEWDIKEQLQLLTIRGKPGPINLIQFTVDKSTKRSWIEFDRLIKQGGAKFKSFY